MFRVSRTAGKKFFQERFENDRYVLGLNDTRRVIYNLPQVLKAEWVVIVEGEKDVESLRKIGITATTSPGGAGKWLDTYADSFKNKQVYIFPDNDDPGRQHALKVAASVSPIAEEVKIIELPGVPEKGDVSDYLKDHSKEKLLALIDDPQPFTQVAKDSIQPLGTKVVESNFKLQTWGDFVNTNFDEQPFTVEGLAPDSGLIAFHGRGKDGKTTLLIHGCRAIASGQPFLNRATIQKPVVYLNYEMGFAYLQKLLSAGGPCPDDAYILNRPEPVLQMTTIEALMVGINQPGVMVIDSFRGAFRLHGDAENSAGGAGVILRTIQDIAVKHKWVVIVIHHKNRSTKEGTDGISGTSDWIAAPDVIWTWSRSDKAKPGTLSVEGRMPPVDPMAVQLTPEECVFMGSIEESREETDKTAILAVLTDEGQAAADIARPSNFHPLQ